MRVLIVSDVTGYMHGGVPAETVHLVRGLAGRGHAVSLAGDVVPAGAEGVRHLKITVPTGAALADELRQALAASRPEVVHVMAMGSRGLAQIAPVLDAVPWLLTCHSLPPHERKLPRWHGSEPLHYGARWLRFLPHAAAWRWLFRRGAVPHAVVHSEAMRRVVTRYGQPASRCRLIPLGCDAADAPPGVRLGPAGPAPRILTMAGLAHTKGQHDAIAAIAKLAGEFPGLTYRIVGEVRDASYVRHVQALVDRHGLGERVRITPNLSHAEKEHALREADLYLQPSHEEGFCLAYIEAAGVVPRLVGTDTGAIAAIGAGDAGARTVPPRSPARMAEAMRELLRLRLPDDVMPRRAARLASTFGWPQYFDAHEALYRSLTQAAPVGRAAASPA